jgi:hypothetical protein
LPTRWHLDGDARRPIPQRASVTAALAPSMAPR